jgi:quercetin dioxygenase-like cupin family protein
VDLWEIATQLELEPHRPQVLRSDDGAARGVALVLPAGEELQEHETHEHTWVFVASGQIEIDEGGRTTPLGVGGLAHFSPGERREVRAREESRLVLLLAPWPGEGHPSRPR